MRFGALFQLISATTGALMLALFPARTLAEEPAYSGWQLYLDNDLFSGESTDRDYTGGLAWSVNGSETRQYWYSLDGWLTAIDRFTGMDEHHNGGKKYREPVITKHSVEIGVTLFTPMDVRDPDPIENDHPYANLLFLANTHQTMPFEGRYVYQSALAIGFLGLPVGEALQKSIHSLVGNSRPQGWDHQISNGGEPTFRYSVGRQEILSATRSGPLSFNLLGGTEIGVGYSTDVTALMNFRWGKFNSPWWSFTPHQADYISLGVTEVNHSEQKPEKELFIWGGASLKLRAYNAILQGQFRHSDVAFAPDELNHLIAEGWLGVTRKNAHGWGLSFVLRGRTNEIRGPNRHGPVWGSIIISHSLR